MSFAGALNVLRPSLPHYLALARHQLLRLTPTAFEFHPSPAAPPLALDMARTVFTLGASACVESYVMSRTLAEGPRVFAFDALTCEALENFDLSVGTADYAQPFPSVDIELPADYTKNRVVPFEGGRHAPDFVAVRHEPAAGCVLVGGFAVRPHWRQGHWRWQGCWVGRREWRRVAITTVLVSGHRVLLKARGGRACGDCCLAVPLITDLVFPANRTDDFLTDNV